MNYTEKRLEEQMEKINHIMAFILLKTFLSEEDCKKIAGAIIESIQQAVAEERERVVGEIEIIKQKYNKIPTSVVNVKIMGVFCEVLASLDKPSTDKE